MVAVVIAVVVVDGISELGRVATGAHVDLGICYQYAPDSDTRCLGFHLLKRCRYAGKQCNRFRFPEHPLRLPSHPSRHRT